MQPAEEAGDIGQVADANMSPHSFSNSLAVDALAFVFLTRTLTSGVMIGGVQQGFIAHPIKSRHEPAFSTIDGHAQRLGWYPLLAQA